jgi:hypothetical protein
MIPKVLEDKICKKNQVESWIKDLNYNNYSIKIVIYLFPAQFSTKMQHQKNLKYKVKMIQESMRITMNWQKQIQKVILQKTNF